MRKPPKVAESALFAGDDVLRISNMTALQTYEVYTQLILVTAVSETKGQTTQLTLRINFGGLYTCSTLCTKYSHAVAVHNVLSYINHIVFSPVEDNFSEAEE
jgi:hypothetical protein